MSKELRQFIRKGALFLVVFIVLVFVLNFIYYKVILEDSIINQKQKMYEELIRNNPQIENGFFGDSHTLSGANTEIVENSFNFGTNAENYVQTYYKLKNILEEDEVRIGRAVLELDLHTFSDLLVDETNLMDHKWFYKDLMSYKEMSEINGNSVLSNYIEANFPFVGHGEQFVIKLRDKKDIKELIRGYGPLEENFDDKDKEKLVQEMFERHFENKSRVNNLSLSYFIKTVELLEENGVVVVFIKYPMSKDYIGYMRGNEIEEESYYREVLRKVNETIDNYEVLDYFDLFIENSEYFHDPGHLNSRGSSVLAQKINFDLKEIEIGVGNNSEEENYDEKIKIFYFLGIIPTILEIIILILLVYLYRKRRVKIHNSVS